MKRYLSILVLFVLFATNVHANSDNMPHYIGEYYRGGVIFYIDPTGQHGLIASVEDSCVAPWSPRFISLDKELKPDIGSGKSNTDIIIKNIGNYGNYAALCAKNYKSPYQTYLESSTTEWYLPSIGELELIHKHRDLIGGFKPQVNYYDEFGKLIGISTLYWSSTDSGENAYYEWMATTTMGDGSMYKKDRMLRVRPITDF